MFIYFVPSSKYHPGKLRLACNSSTNKGHVSLVVSNKGKGMQSSSEQPLVGRIGA